ncbi:hypothetical protein EGJ27_17715 [Pseudomonas sp. v388]|uniref:hypothetical protein n=1 Tax=Pseudomonas sp. v388 TaxID=2479849 RepID=UPI000F77A84F|nr:hypothetical protein [Pseudomonas sp. v388]RRV05650.1 hypothetical protein EGJ27_17715 [Pseudomonas sp. v388]
MSAYKILCYRDKFEFYKRITSPKTREIPANEQDEFALLVCITTEGDIGFDASADAALLLGALAQGSYVLAGAELFYESNILPAESRAYTFRPKDQYFGNMIKAYEKSELDAKKYKIMSRHRRPCPIPKTTSLTEFLKLQGHPINERLYKEIIENCHYVTKEVGSGEHGHGALEVFSDNLDFFFDDLKRLINGKGELIFVDHSQLPYH